MRAVRTAELAILILAGTTACRDGSRTAAATQSATQRAQPSVVEGATARPRFAEATSPSAVVAAAPPAVPAVPTVPTVPALIHHPSPGGVDETCQLLPQFPFVPADVVADPDTMRWYRDADRDDIAALCALDLYEPTATTGVCPKLIWSTPALEIYDLSTAARSGKALGKAAFEAKQCSARKRRAPKIAKFKAPVYDQESQSALAYFHLSRLLGSSNVVVPVTFRTVDRRRFQGWAADALRFLQAVDDPITPRGGWYRVRNRYRKPASKDAALDVVWGALAKNPRGEEGHEAFERHPISHNYIGAAGAYRATAYYKLVASRKPIGATLRFDPAKPRDYHATLQALTFAQDFTHLVILDHLLKQRDRSGNIHQRTFTHFVDDAGYLRWQKSAPEGSGATVTLDRLLLKDNDDGLKWNAERGINTTLLIPDLRHLDSIMFARVQWLAGLLADAVTEPQVHAYFTDAAHVSDEVYAKIRERVIDLAARFAKAYAAGTLVLDLDLEAVIAAAPALPPNAPGRK